MLRIVLVLAGCVWVLGFTIKGWERVSPLLFPGTPRSDSVRGVSYSILLYEELIKEGNTPHAIPGNGM